MLQHHIRAKSCESPANGEGNGMQVNTITFGRYLKDLCFDAPQNSVRDAKSSCLFIQSLNSTKRLTVHTVVCTVLLVEFSYV
jgi:hypothetical protein